MHNKPLVWLHGQVKSPPFSLEGHIEAGILLGSLQDNELLGLPESRPMPDIGAHVHELRINDENPTWRIIYRIDADAIVIAEVFSKKTQQTPLLIINTCKRRFRHCEI